MSPPSQLSALQNLLVQVAAIERRHYHPATDRRENVAEHSISVASLAWFLHQQVGSQLDLALIMKYALVHDFVEIHAGDVNTYAGPDARNQKELRESEALKIMSGDFRFFPDLIQTLESYQAMQNEEAKFVWAVDKLQAYILGYLDNWRAYREYPVSKTMFDAKIDEQLARCPHELKSMFAEITTWCKETY